MLDAERAGGIRRRAQQQPAGAAAALVDARRVRAALRALAERGPLSERVRAEGLAEINRVLGRSAGTRRVELRGRRHVHSLRSFPSATRSPDS